MKHFIIIILFVLSCLAFSKNPEPVKASPQCTIDNYQEFVFQENNKPTYCELDFSNLRGQNLQHANLQGALLLGANLSEVDLSYADLRGADLRHVNARFSDFSYADLRGADLYRAYLRYTNLYQTKVTAIQAEYLKTIDIDSRYGFVIVEEI